MNQPLAALALLLWIICSACSAAERPNVVWITSEDNASHWMGCYGNDQGQTPRIDDLASRSVLFTNAYSNAPVCAVARCTLLHGVYSVSLGTQHMRSRHEIPASIRPYVYYLKEQGYYCTNRSKTDFNRAGNDKAIWDECGKQAHYKNRAKNQPFFSIFNLTVCHESSLFPQKIAANRQKGVIPKTTRLQPSEIELPPHLPDLPEIRKDFAIYYDVLTAMDQQVGKLLDELQTRGLSDNTIVFYYADHGGPTPRGKRYLKDTGVRVPLLVHVPAKWKELSPFENKSKTDELVAFVDFGPTLMSLCGIPKPANIQGRPFLGQHRAEPPEDDFVLLYGDRFDEFIGMRRGITNGKYKYIRHFLPHLPTAPYSYYQFSMPGWTAWQNAWKSDQLSPYHSSIWELPACAEELYDVTTDPWEINNLVNDPQHAQTTARLRNRLKEKMGAVRDTGLIPESMFQTRKLPTIHEFAQSERFDLDRILEAAFLASEANSENLPALKELLTDQNEVVRYWATVGCAALQREGSPAQEHLKALLEDADATIRLTAAMALYRTGAEEQGKSAILNELEQKLSPEQAMVMCNAFYHLDCGSDVPSAWIAANLKSDNEYVRRFATQLQAQRQELQPVP